MRKKKENLLSKRPAKKFNPIQTGPFFLSSRTRGGEEWEEWGGGGVGLHKYKSKDNDSWRIYSTSKDVCFPLRTSKETSLDVLSFLQESLLLLLYLWGPTPPPPPPHFPPQPPLPPPLAPEDKDNNNNNNKNNTLLRNHT